METAYNTVLEADARTLCLLLGGGRVDGVAGWCDQNVGAWLVVDLLVVSTAPSTCNVGKTAGVDAIAQKQ